MVGERLSGDSLYQAVSEQIEHYSALLDTVQLMVDRLKNSSNEAERELGRILASFQGTFKPEQEWRDIELGTLYVGYSIKREQARQRVTVRAQLPAVYTETLLLETDSQKTIPLLGSQRAKIVHTLEMRDRKPERNENNTLAISRAESLRETIKTHLLEG